MNNKIFNRISGLFLFALLVISCKGTSTDEYLSGDFINGMDDKTPPSTILPLEADIIFNSIAVLQWTSKKDAAYYTVEIAESKEADFSIQIAGSPFRVDAPETMLAVDLPAASATYCWRVRADITSPGLYGQSSFESMDDAVYVYCPAAVSTPDDTGMAGNKSKPYQTIMRGIAEADSLNLKTIKVAARGSSSAYNEVVVLREGISMYGGYTADFTESARDNALNRTIIKGEHGMTVRAKDIVLATVFDGFVVQGQDDGVDSYAVHIDSCYFDFIIQNCDITGAVSDADNITSYGIYIKNSYVTIQYNTINGGEEALFGYGIYINSGNPEIRNNEISSGSNIKQLSCGIRIVDNCAPLVMDNTITGGSASFGSEGVRIENSTDIPIFINNVISSGVANYSYGFYIYESQAKLFNNTIIGGDANDDAFNISAGIRISGTLRPYVYNNIVTTIELYTTRYGIYGEPTGHSNNCFYAAAGTDGTYYHYYDPDVIFSLNNELTLFPDLSSSYHLQPSSPLDERYGGLNIYINRWINYPFNTDKDGNQRTGSLSSETGQSFGDGWSMGAYEY